MPDNKNQNQGNRKNQGVAREDQQGDSQGQQQGNRGNQSQQDGNQRQQQGNRGQQQQGGKASTHIERDNVNPVGNDNDQDRDLETEDQEEAITQRSPRMGEQEQQGQRQVDRGGQGGPDRDPNRNRE